MINQIIHGNNLEVLKTIPDNTFDMIYCDPPFLKQRTFTKNEFEFEDYYKNMEDYLSQMKSILLEIKRVLKPSGWLYWQHDHTTEARIELLMQEVFYGNCIVEKNYWDSCGRVPLANGKYSFNVFEKILRVKASLQSKSVANPEYIDNPIEKELIKMGYKQEIDGEWYKWSNLATTRFNRPFTNKDYANRTHEVIDVKPKKGSVWIFAKPKIEELLEKGWVRHGKIRQGTIEYKHKYRPQPINNYWEIKNDNDARYPTQKPKKLLERIIKMSTNEGMTIGELFCGSGTACVVAKELGRNYLGIDISEKAVELSRKRLENTSKRLL